MVCEICWWLSLALFVKAMRIPWALASLDSDTAYAGIGYSVKTMVKEKWTSFWVVAIYTTQKVKG